MRALRFAWLSLVRQPVRSLLGILGVAAVAALLFDMLLLSRGLVISFGELLDRSGFDVRVLATDAPPLTGPPLTGAAALVTDISALPEIEAVLQLRIHHAEIVTDGTSATGTGGTRTACPIAASSSRLHRRRPACQIDVDRGRGAGSSRSIVLFVVAGHQSPARKAARRRGGRQRLAARPVRW